MCVCDDNGYGDVMVMDDGWRIDGLMDGWVGGDGAADADADADGMMKCAMKPIMFRKQRTPSCRVLGFRKDE